MCYLNVLSSRLPKPVDVEVADGKLIPITNSYTGCSIEIDGSRFPITLLPMCTAGFDIVLGIDWLSENHAEILCSKKHIKIPLPNGSFVMAHVDSCKEGLNFISVLKARKRLKKGCESYLAYVHDAKNEKKTLDNVKVVSEYPGMFPYELPGMPPDRQVEFKIDLVPGATPIV